MIKVTKLENNEKGLRVLLKEDDKKVEIVNGVMVVTKDGKKGKATKRIPKKYKEAIESYMAKKGLKVEDKMEEKEVAKVEVKEVKEVKEKSSVAKYIEEKREEKNSTLGNVKNEDEEKSKEEFFKNMSNIPLTFKTMVIDATCKAHKEEIDGVKSRFTKFTIFVTTDNKELNERLINCLVENMEKNLVDGFGYGFEFDRNTLTSYKRGDDICHEMTLTIPLMSGMSEIRKNVCTCYYASKKNVQAFYKQIKAWKMRQQQSTTNTKKKSSKKEDNKSV